MEASSDHCLGFTPAGGDSYEDDALFHVNDTILTFNVEKKKTENIPKLLFLMLNRQMLSIAQ